MRYVFGECEIDTERYELCRRGLPVRTEPQVIELLLLLVRNPDRLVSKEEIMATVWKGRIVSDSALSARMSAVRRAIGDTLGDEGLIRTIFRRGFRFVGRVTMTDAARAPEFAVRAARESETANDYLTGVFACYSHAWSPAFEGGLIRGSLVVRRDAASPALQAVYTELLPGLTLRHRGPVGTSERILYLDLADTAADSRLFLTLRFPSPPASALLGAMSGKVFHHANMEVAVTRFVAVRVPAAADRIEASNRYLDPATESVARDLASLGRHMASPADVDRIIDGFLNPRATGGVFRVTAADTLELNVALDRALALSVVR
jgi:DNA-binding winged helix-turn-helix (wHTH) protein